MFFGFFRVATRALEEFSRRSEERENRLAAGNH
jgi:hypothetical protein